MNYVGQKRAYETQGFIVVRQLLSADEFAELQGELDRYLREVVPTLPETYAFYQDRTRPETLKQLHNMAVDPYFAAYRQHARWNELATALLGEPAQALEPEWFGKPPRTPHPTPPHQDNHYFKLVPPSVLTIWMALEEIDEENGCLRYVTGSHREGMRPHSPTQVLGVSQGITDYGPADTAREVAIHLSPGDVVCHHGHTIHRAEPNNSATRHRRAFAIVFQGESAQRDEIAFAEYQRTLQTQQAALKER
jgi:phytanoyl-CoA hydroxylase